MKRHEFNTEVRRLLTQFGESFYSEDRMQLIWLAMERFSAKQFKCIVDHLIADCKSPPMRKEFLSAAQGFDRDNNSEDALARLKRDMPLCQKCGNVGLIQAINKNDTYTCAFRCTCPIGQKLSRQIREFTSDDSETWTLIEHHTGDVAHNPSAALDEPIMTNGSISIYKMPGYVEIPKEERDRLVKESKKRAGEFEQVEVDFHEYDR